jgi:RNA polymerase sigma-70 factor (ECF subfamily)
VKPLGQTTIDEVELLLTRLRAGDAAAVDALVAITLQRLRELATAMLRRFDRLRRWHDSDDVLQGATQRLIRALRDVRPSESKEFYALAATAMRRELIDLHRQFYGPLGRARRYRSPPPGDVEDHRLEAADDDESWTGKLLDTLSIHDAVESLPTELREVVDLLYYDGVDQSQAARSLGISTKTVSRRWREARLALRRAITGAATDGEGP